MAERKKPTPFEAFEISVHDARRLLHLADGFTNNRSRRMRKELRCRVGDAIRIPQKGQDALDCIESDDIFVVFKPDSRFSRADFSEHLPLLRAALVLGCAAFETYLAEKSIQVAREIIRTKQELPRRLKQIGLEVSDWEEIETYNYRRRGLTEVVIVRHLRSLASTSPSQVGLILSTVGCEKPMACLDKARKVTDGTTEEQLKALTDRRNRIVHAADWQGRRRAHLAHNEVQQSLDCLESIVQAIDQTFSS